MTISPYNLIIIMAITVLAISVGAVVLLGDADRAGRYITFLGPILIPLVGAALAAQNKANHEENSERLNHLEDTAARKE